jgi:hypothetical protein
MREVRSNVIHVRFRKPEPKRPKRQGLALTFRAGDGYVFIAASGRAKYTLKEVSELIQDLRDLRADAKARLKRG